MARRSTPLMDRGPRKRLFLENKAYVFSHTLEEQVGGQLRAGFVLLNLLEDVDGGGLGESNIPILSRCVP